MEIWKDIKNFEGYYQISNQGRVKSLERLIQRKDINPILLKERILNQYLEGKGYLAVSLSKEGTYKQFKVHRLVGEYFIPNPENKPQINHKDGNKINNNDWNLEWSTNSENQLHSYRNNLNEKRFLGDNFNAKRVINILTNKSYSSAKEAFIDYNTGSYGYFVQMLNGTYSNKTNFKYE